MIDERFAATKFEACGLNSQAARELADLLTEEINKEMSEVLMTHFLGIIAKLNNMGHSLKEYEEPSIDHLAFRDDWQDEDGRNYFCKLRVAFNMSVSTGYAHLYSPEIDNEDGC